MPNPFNGSRLGKPGGKNRASRKPKIEGQDLSLVRGLDKLGHIRHLVTPENLGDPTRNAAKHREVSRIEETSADYLIPRKSLGRQQLLRLFPIFGEPTTRITRTIAPKGVQGDKIIVVPYEVIDRKTGKHVGSWDAILKQTTLSLVTVVNTVTVGRPVRSLLIPGSPFPVIKDTPTKGSTFPYINPRTKRIDYSSPDARETTLGVTETVSVDDEDLDFYPTDDSAA
jgi:hypothetical protein